MVVSCPGTSFLGIRLMMGFEGLSTEPPLLLIVLKGFGPGDYHFHLSVGSLMITLVAFADICNFPFGITLLHSINLLQWYLSPFGVDTAYDLGVFSPGVDITVASFHRLMLGAFCSHTGCWSRSSGSSFAWASCPAYFCLLRRLLKCCLGLW